MDNWSDEMELKELSLFNLAAEFISVTGENSYRKTKGMKMRGDYPNRIIMSFKNKVSQSILLIKQLDKV